MDQLGESERTVSPSVRYCRAYCLVYSQISWISFLRVYSEICKEENDESR